MSRKRSRKSTGADVGVPLALPDITKAEIDAVGRVMRSGWLTTGAEVERFEEEFAAACGAQHAIAVSSATAGLHLSAMAAKSQYYNSKIILPVWTFTASAHAVELADMKPLFYDCDPVTLLMRGDMHKPDTTPMLVSIGGEVCHSKSMSAIEDRAHMMPMPVSKCFAAVYSFYATKPIACGEGGMIVTDDPQVAKFVRERRFHGFDTEAFDRHVSGDRSQEVVRQGFKYNMTDIAAAIGREQLKRREKMLHVRRWLAQRYDELLSGCWLPPSRSSAHSHHLYIVQVPHRESFLFYMQEIGIGCGFHYRPLHQHKYWRQKYSLDEQGFPGADAAATHTVTLPLFSTMTIKQQDRVIKAVKEFFK